MALPRKQTSTSTKISGAGRPTSTMGAASAKTHFLSVMEEVKTSGTPVTVTKRGTPQVQIVPLAPVQPVQDIFGCMKGSVTILGDVVGPEPDEWEAMQ